MWLQWMFHRLRQKSSGRPAQRCNTTVWIFTAFARSAGRKPNNTNKFSRRYFYQPNNYKGILSCQSFQERKRITILKKHLPANRKRTAATFTLPARRTSKDSRIRRTYSATRLKVKRD